MKSLLEMLETPFRELRFEQQLLLAVLLLGCLCLAGWSVFIAARRLRERRRDPRRKLNSPVELCWQGRDGHLHSVVGQCVDSSVAGLKAELPCLLEARTNVDFRILGLNASGAAVVRNCTRVGSKYSVGLEFKGVFAGLGAPPHEGE